MDEGQLPAPADADPASLDGHLPARAIGLQAKAWAGWFGAYGLNAVGGWLPQISFLSEAVDHVDAAWVAFVFLNMPLQLVLFTAAMLLVRSPSPLMRRGALYLSMLLSSLILGHIVISVATLTTG